MILENVKEFWTEVRRASVCHRVAAVSDWRLSPVDFVGGVKMAKLLLLTECRTAVS